MTDNDANRLAAINTVAAAMHVAADVGGDLEGDYDISMSVASEAAVEALIANPGVLRALAGEAEPAGDVPPMWLTEYWGVIEPDGSGNYRTIGDGAYVAELPADAVRLVPAGGSAPADTGAAALVAFADDIDRRIPNLRDPDPLSDWSRGVAWAVDRARAVASDSAPTEDLRPTREMDDDAADRVISWSLFGTTDTDLVPDDSDLPVGELRRLVREVAVPSLRSHGLLRAGGSALADEVEQLRWERDMALSRVAAAEEVQCRMGDSLPASGPWESWSERDRAVRDYEGDLSAALATEDDIVGERLREVEGERDEALAEVERLTAALQPPMDSEYLSDVERNAVALAAEVQRMQQERDDWRSVAESYRRSLSKMPLAGGSAPHQGATTDVTAPAQHPEGEAACTICRGHGIVTDPGYYVPGEQFVEPPSEDQCGACAGTGASDVQRLVSQRAAVLSKLDDLEADGWRTVVREVRALLGAGGTPDETGHHHG